MLNFQMYSRHELIEKLEKLQSERIELSAEILNLRKKLRLAEKEIKRERELNHDLVTQRNSLFQCVRQRLEN